MIKDILNTFVSRVASRYGRSEYIVDESLSSSDLVTILFKRFTQIVRGSALKIFIKTDGAFFVGKGCQFKAVNKMQFGRNVIIGDFVEINALSKCGVRFGDNVTVSKNGIIECSSVLNNLGEGLQIGNNVGIAQNVFIQVRGKVIIGNDVIIGPNVTIISENHNHDDLNAPIRLQGVSRKGIVIGDGTWVGTGAKILDGVNIGRNSIIAAGSVVIKDVEEFSVVGGVPAKYLKTRKI